MKQLSLRSYCCLRNFLPQNVLHLYCVKHSITRTARSRTSFKWTKQMSVNWSPVHTNTLQIGAVRPSKWVSNGAFYRHLSLLLRMGTYPGLKDSLRRMLCPTQMAVDLC